jgi:hypothetical protein
MAIVPLRECKIPTLMVLPLLAPVDAAEVGLVVVVEEGLLPQAFRKILVPKVAEP